MNDLKSVRRPLLLIAALVSLAFLVLQISAVGMPPGGSSYDWVFTDEAQTRTAAGECYDPNATVQEICVEMCLISQEGHVVPQGEFRCMLY